MQGSLTESRTSQPVVHGTLAWIGAERLKDIAVRVRIPAKQSAEHRHKPPEVLEIDPSPRGPVGFAKIEDQQPATGSKHPLEFPEAAIEIRQIAQSVADGDGFKRGIVKWQVQGIALKKPWRIAPGAPFRSLTCHPQHGGAEVQPGGLGPLPGQGKRHVASPAAYIESAGSGPDAGQAHQSPFPQPMQTKTLEIVDEVVTRGHSGEQVIDPRRARFRRIADHMVLAAHRDDPIGLYPDCPAEATAGTRFLVTSRFGAW